ncbi:sperm-associated antigen 1A isoform X2 [Phyllopteryx taeniolatus]|uniref:sperm-associated antigen 1A isoform X2 n=1 Tax=Phyllopteryx taeniolatus TaxID=161469 RepID=UPI002AD29F68|nr:sperm-associated antigen 1A isoform X2 [Phyllopteryx taeniolatus]
MNFSLLVMIFFKYNISCTIILKKINLLLLLFFILSRRNPLRGVALHAALNSPRTSPTQRCVIQGVYPNRNPPSRWSCCGFESSGRGRGRTHCRGGTAMGNAQQKPPGSGGGGSGPGAMGNGSRFKEVANENAERISPGGLEGPQCPAVDQSYLDAPAGGLPPHLARIKNEGNYLFKQGQFGDALDKYTKAIDGCAQAGISNPEDLCVLYTNRAACYLKDGNSADCIEDCTKALQLQPYHLKALLRRAMAYESLERYRRAYADYKTVLQMDTGVQAAHDSVHRITRMLIEQDGPEWREKLPEIPAVPLSVQREHREKPVSVQQARARAARALCEEARRKEYRFNALKHEGNQLVKKNHFQDALHKYSECLALKPDECGLYTNRAICLLELNRFQEAKQDCDAALHLEPGNKKAFYRRALAHKGLKNYLLASGDLEEVLRLDPNVGEAERELLEVTALLRRSLMDDTAHT